MLPGNQEVICSPKIVEYTPFEPEAEEVIMIEVPGIAPEWQLHNQVMESESPSIMIKDVLGGIGFWRLSPFLFSRRRRCWSRWPGRVDRTKASRHRFRSRLRLEAQDGANKKIKGAQVSVSLMNVPPIKIKETGESLTLNPRNIQPRKASFFDIGRPYESPIFPPIISQLIPSKIDLHFHSLHGNPSCLA